MRLDELRRNLSKAKGYREAVSFRLTDVRSRILSLEEEEKIADLSASLIRTLVDREITENVKAVECLLTEGLKSVFLDQDLRVEALVEILRGKVSVELLTIQTQADGTVTSGLSREAYGGAVTTVQSVLLRIIVLLKRGLRPILIMDESLPAFDSTYVDNMGLFLKTICARLGIDILLVSHNPAMVEAADRAYRIQKINGAAVFRKIR